MTAPLTNPFTGWLRCDECGAEPDTPCMDLDDRPVSTACDGRQRKTVTCTHCHREAQRSGKTSVVGGVYCSAPTCRRAYNRAYEAHRRRSRRQTKATCAYCGAERVRGRGKASVPACASVECRRKAKSDRQKVRKAKPPKPQRTSTCQHCGVVFACIMSTAKYCGPTCRYRHTTTYQPVTPPAGSP